MIGTEGVAPVEFRTEPLPTPGAAAIAGALDTLELTQLASG